MNRKTAWKRFALAAASGGLLALSGGCSFFYELNTTQCERDSDCRALGSAFIGTECRNRVCVLPTAGTGGTGGSDPVGGMGGGGTGNAGSGNAGTGGDSGNAGTGGMGECTTNAECIAELGLPHVCRENACIPLLSDECPLIIPERTDNGSVFETLMEHEQPLFLGAYSEMQAGSPHETLSVLSWEFALREFNDAFLQGGPTIQGKTRPIMAVVCHTLDTDLEASMDHLTTNVGARGILSALPADGLLEAFSYTDHTGPDPVLFLSSLSADLRLADLDDNGFVWHMLGNPRLIAPPLTALVKRAETLVQARRLANMPANNPDEPATEPNIRVLLVTSDTLTTRDISTTITSPAELDDHPERVLTFNGAPAFDPINRDYYDVATIESGGLEPDVSQVIAKVREFKPHIIVAVTTKEFAEDITAMAEIETNWDIDIAPGQIRPFYVFGPQMVSAGDNLVNLANSFSRSQLSTRMVGVNFARTTNARSLALYNVFAPSIKAAYKDSGEVERLPFTENFYDAAYYLAYALVGSGRANPTGDLLRAALETRVLFGTERADVGPASVEGTVGALLNRATYGVQLYGTLGPPDFNPVTGTRVSQTSAWCIHRPPNAAWQLLSDQALFDPESNEFPSEIGCVDPAF